MGDQVIGSLLQRLNDNPYVLPNKPLEWTGPKANLLTL
jgi:hypothetical protein